MSASLDLGFGQSVLNGLSNWLQGKENVSNSKELMDYQSKKELETQSILNQRLYPQQVASMRMAGLNPAMISAPMSQGASTPSATQNMPAVSMDFLDAAAIGSQIELNKAQANAFNAEAENKREDTVGKSYLNDVFYENYFANLELQGTEATKNRMESANLEQSTKNLEQSFKNMTQEFDNLVKQGKLTEEQIKQVEPIAKAQIAEMLSNVSYLSHKDKREIKENTWLVEYYAALASNTGMDMQLKRELVKYQQLLNMLKKRYGDTSEVVQIVSEALGGVGSALSGAAAVKGKPLPVTPMNSTTTNYNKKGEVVGSSTTTKY